MDLAVEMMGKSVMEPRVDGKAPPRVGAVLLKPDGAVVVASRGEMRLGDHAEYTLLERKCASEALDGAVLFTTLEPCAPGARSLRKTSCAERIVAARIREVWVGLPDPDPTVDRKGIKFLQDSGVDVQLFDRDLQEAIAAANREFIDQAEERAAAEREEKSEAVVLSDLEGPFDAANLSDLSREALTRYRDALGLTDDISSASFVRRLGQQGLLEASAKASIPTGFGMLLFGKEPRMKMPQSGLLGTIHYAGGKEETRDFDGPAVLVPEQVLQWLKDKLPNAIDRSKAQRVEEKAELYELVREGVVNALVHRDYGIAGAKCQLVVTPQTITVRSPGAPVSPIKMDQLRAFDAPMLSRNPVLHFVFAKLKLAEERGLGLKSMRTRAARAGFPLPEYGYTAPYVDLVLHREEAAVAPPGPQEVIAKLKDSERAGWAWLSTRDAATASEYQAAMKVPNRTAKNHLKKLTSLGLIRMEGAGRATCYRVNRR